MVIQRVKASGEINNNSGMGTRYVRVVITSVCLIFRHFSNLVITQNVYNAKITSVCKQNSSATYDAITNNTTLRRLRRLCLITINDERKAPTRQPAAAVR